MFVPQLNLLTPNEINKATATISVVVEESEAFISEETSKAASTAKHIPRDHAGSTRDFWRQSGAT